MVEISVFADESGEVGTESKYYLLTLVLHEQNKPIITPIPYSLPLLLFERVEFGLHGRVVARKFFDSQVLCFVVGKTQLVLAA